MPGPFRTFCRLPALLRLLRVPLAGLALAGSAWATSPLPPAAVTISVTPALAAAAVPRTISVSVPAGLLTCGLTASVVPSSPYPSRTIVVMLTIPFPPPPCAAIFGPTRYDVAYIPQSEEELRVMVITSDGVFYGEAPLTTRAAGSQRSRLDLTGMWFDPATIGSGVTFVHAAKRNDSVFGTWFLYDVNGSPRWYTIQNVQWRGDGMEAEGALLEGAAGISICPLTLIGCPLALTAAQELGRARIVLQGDGSARIFAIGFGGTVLFTSSLVRAGI